MLIFLKILKIIVTKSFLLSHQVEAVSIALGISDE